MAARRRPVRASGIDVHPATREIAEAEPPALKRAAPWPAQATCSSKNNRPPPARHVAAESPPVLAGPPSHMTGSSSRLPFPFHGRVMRSLRQMAARPGFDRGTDGSRLSGETVSCQPPIRRLSVNARSPSTRRQARLPSLRETDEDLAERRRCRCRGAA